MDSKNLELSYDKCYKIHVGKSDDKCPTLLINKLPMREEKRQKYLGEIISASTKVDDNIEEKYKKGLGVVNQILGILREITFGNFYFQTAIILRNGMLLPSILTNIEVIHNLQKKHIEKLESLDKIY